MTSWSISRIEDSLESSREEEDECACMLQRFQSLPRRLISLYPLTVLEAKMCALQKTRQRAKDIQILQLTGSDTVRRLLSAAFKISQYRLQQQSCTRGK
jgi:hypothetical protein